MDLSQNQTVKGVAALLLLAAVSQPIYTVLYMYAPDVDRHFLWGLEGFLFVLLAAFAGSALVMAQRLTLGYSAIAFAAVLNVVQVGVGLTQFGPFGQAAAADPELGVLAGAVVAYSFFGYNAAKILLALAAVVFGLAKVKDGGKVLGGVTVVVGVVAFAANTMVMMFGRDGFVPSPLAGGSGVLATVLLAICLLRYRDEA